MNRWRIDITTVLLCVVLACCGSMCWNIHTLSAGLNRIINHQEAPMQSVTTTVTNSDDIQFTITTPRAEGESNANWAARHMASVNLFKES